MTVEQVARICMPLRVLRYFPGGDDGLAAVALLVHGMVSTCDQAQWLVGQVVTDWDEWRGPASLREVYERRYRPRDAA